MYHSRCEGVLLLEKRLENSVEVPELGLVGGNEAQGTQCLVVYTILGRKCVKPILRT